MSLLSSNPPMKLFILEEKPKSLQWWLRPHDQTPTSGFISYSPPSLSSSHPGHLAVSLTFQTHPHWGGRAFVLDAATAWNTLPHQSSNMAQALSSGFCWNVTSEWAFPDHLFSFPSFSPLYLSSSKMLYILLILFVDYYFLLAWKLHEGNNFVYFIHCWVVPVKRTLAQDKSSVNIYYS